jgi:uncharacterized membrane protein YhiD involved in acid resistance
MFLVASLRGLLQGLTNRAVDWSRVPEALALAAGVTFVGAAAVFLLMLAFWPITRRNLGRHLEEQVESWSLERLEEEIAREAVAWRASSKRLEDAHRRRLAWLYEKRKELHALDAPAHLHEKLTLRDGGG